MDFVAVSSDFSPISSLELTFQPGRIEECAEITIQEDTILEGSETFSIQVNTRDQNVTLTPANTTITIEDNDSKTIRF